MRQAIVKGVPEIANTAGLLACHMEAVLEGGEVALRRRTRVVVQSGAVAGAVLYILIEVCRENIWIVVMIGAGRLVISGRTM